MARIPWSRAFGVDEAVLAKSLDESRSPSSVMNAR
jgi:hypothetical protein